jgi:hypothetical protein
LLTAGPAAGLATTVVAAKIGKEIATTEAASNPRLIVNINSSISDHPGPPRIAPPFWVYACFDNPDVTGVTLGRRRNATN